MTTDHITIRFADASAGAMALAFQIDRYAEAMQSSDAQEYWRHRISGLLAIYGRLSAAAWPNLTLAERRQPITRQEVFGADLEAVGT